MLTTSMGTLQAGQTETPFRMIAQDEIPTFKKSVQKGFKKKAPDPMNFKMLPREVLEEIGETTRIGSARMELAILSHLCASQAKTDAGEVQYEQGFTATLGDGEFIQTMETTAEDIAFRWRVFEKREELHYPDGSRKKEFDTFYKRIQRGFKKLLHWGWIHKVEFVNPKFQGIYGTVWKLNTRLEKFVSNLPDCPEPPPLLIAANISAEDVFVNCIDRTGQHFLSESADEYIAAKCATSVYDHDTYYRHDEWCDAVAENQIDQPRHVSVGAFKPEHVKWINETTPCTVPWIILEPEDGDLNERYNSTTNILETMHAEGVDLSPVVVTFSGNKSFHIRIPQGMFGNPVYRSVENCAKVLRRFAADNFEERLDTELFDPRHLVRCTGSLHEEGGRVIAFAAYDFLNISFNQLLTYLLDGTTKNPHKESPREAKPCSWLTDRLVDASDSFSRFWIPASCDVSTDKKEMGAFAASLKGCAENENWFGDHVGRNKLVFVAACCLLKKYDEITAFDELEKVNRKNDPPLPSKEVKTCFNSAKRTLSRRTK